MRLLNCRTMELEDFFHKGSWVWHFQLRGKSVYRAPRNPVDYIPNYYILSHCWGDDEISYKDFTKGRKQHSAGRTKILSYCQYASQRHQVWRQTDTAKRVMFPEDCYVWCDTICIDKRSSAELSEAINSMWQYYRNAVECHVYLADVHAPEDCVSVRPPAGPYRGGVCDQPSTFAADRLADSRWFTRGWTLQELLAPELVTFMYSDWTTMGHKCGGRNCRLRAKGLASPGLTAALEGVTSIERSYLDRSSHIQAASIAKRMSWASRRRTTRIEDEAYSLLGIFGVNMPLLYGEGSNAFKRLQETIMSQSTDHSLFAHRGTYLLALRSSDFDRYANVCRRKTKGSTWPYTMTNLGVEFRMDAQRGVVRQSRPGTHHEQKLQLIRVVLDAFHEPPGRKAGQQEADPHFAVNLLFRTSDTEYPQVYHRLGGRTTEHFLRNVGGIKFHNVGEPELMTFYVSPRRSLDYTPEGLMMDRLEQHLILAEESARDIPFPSEISHFEPLSAASDRY